MKIKTLKKHWKSIVVSFGGVGTLLYFIIGPLYTNWVTPSTESPNIILSQTIIDENESILEFKVYGNVKNKKNLWVSINESSSFLSATRKKVINDTIYWELALSDSIMNVIGVNNDGQVSIRAGLQKSFNKTYELGYINLSNQNNEEANLTALINNSDQKIETPKKVSVKVSIDRKIKRAHKKITICFNDKYCKDFPELSSSVSIKVPLGEYDITLKGDTDQIIQVKNSYDINEFPDEIFF